MAKSDGYQKINKKGLKIRKDFSQSLDIFFTLYYNQCGMFTGRIIRPIK